LGHVDDVCPVLLILGLEVPQEVVEALIPLRQVLNGSIKGLTFSLLVVLDKTLNFFDFIDGFGSTGVACSQWLLSVIEEKHAAFLEFVLGGVQDHMRSDAFYLGEEHMLHGIKVRTLRTELTQHHLRL
jgi:hypothetical protein